jgi:uncharacterized protein (UPF0261 family)
VKRVLIVGTADTKGEELAYLRTQVAEAGAHPILVDVGIGEPQCAVDVSRHRVAQLDPAILEGRDRGVAVARMGEAFEKFLASFADFDAVLGIGGGGGTSIITRGMRSLPVGLPKLVVSTLASGNVAPYVDVTDISMMPSVTDLAGLNRVSRAVLRNAAYAIAGMAAAPASAPAHDKPSVGLTMFGVTTPCVTKVVEQLKGRYDCMVFHATGTGGRAMEKLTDSGQLDGLLDVTTTEICDLLFDGVLSAGEDRLGAVARSRVPYVGSVGALDMVNFGAMDAVPERYRRRHLYAHNPQVTLMRTTAPECRAIGEWIAAKLNLCGGPVRFLIPEKGVSALDAEGGAFFDPEADAALFDALEKTLRQDDRRRLVRLPLHINDAAFAVALADNFIAIAE